MSYTPTTWIRVPGITLSVKYRSAERSRWRGNSPTGTISVCSCSFIICWSTISHLSCITTKGSNGHPERVAPRSSPAPLNESAISQEQNGEPTNRNCEESLSQWNHAPFWWSWRFDSLDTLSGAWWLWVVAMIPSSRCPKSSPAFPRTWPKVPLSIRQDHSIHSNHALK